MTTKRRVAAEQSRWRRWRGRTCPESRAVSRRAWPRRSCRPMSWHTQTRRCDAPAATVMTRQVAWNSMRIPEPAIHACCRLCAACSRRLRMHGTMLWPSRPPDSSDAFPASAGHAAGAGLRAAADRSPAARAAAPARHRHAAPQPQWRRRPARLALNARAAAAAAANFAAVGAERPHADAARAHGVVRGRAGHVTGS